MIIVCGYKSIGRTIVQNLKATDAEFTVIDAEESRLKDADFPFIVGDPIDEGVLKKAGIDEAEVVIAAMEKDVNNSFIVLTAKAIKPSLTVLACVNKTHSINRLYKAGADLVVSEAVIGGRLLAKNAISPYVAEFVDRITLAKNVEITEIKVHKGSKISGCQIKNSRLREQSGVTIIAIKKGDNLLLNPPSSIELETNDILVTIGSGTQIKMAALMARGEKAN
jgi:voltage-gated potassium channel